MFLMHAYHSVYIIQNFLGKVFQENLKVNCWVQFVYLVWSDCHDDDDDISLKSTSNIVFVSAVLLKHAKAFMTKQIVRNPNISPNLKNLPRWEFLDRRQRHVWGKGNEWWLSILTINDGNRVITSDPQKYIRNKFKSRSSQSSHATSMWNKMKLTKQSNNNNVKQDATHMWMARLL